MRSAILPGVLLALGTAANLVGQESSRLSVTARSAPDSLVGVDGRPQDAERTTLTIRQRSPASADTVQLDVVYLRLAARGPGAGAPIVFLMGGPGVPASVIGRIPPYWTLFDRLRSVADVILLDQRGVGLSTPALTCPPTTHPAPDFLMTRRRMAEELASAYAPCVAHWRDRGMPAELFTVSDVADDIEAVRRQLGVPRVSLLGFSYGTRIALEYAHRYPERVDRLALQGVLGFEHVARFPTVLDSVLARLSAAAARDSVARASVPDLRSALARRFGALEQAPLTVRVATPAGDSAWLTIGKEGLQALVALRAGDPRLVPLAGSLAAGDTRLLAALAGGIYGDLAAGGGSLFGRAMYCSAPAPEARERRARALAATSPLGEVFDNVPASVEFCRAIGITPGPRARAPERPIPRPALLITGTLDDRTPLDNADETRRYFTPSWSVTVENGGHELLPLDTVQALVVTFFRAGRVDTDRIATDPPRFPSVAEALLPARRR
jgi:pimeloyl-ACP methyl ester carboxylesterase